MVKCSCGLEMKEVDSCRLQRVKIEGKIHNRINDYFDRGKRCHDCNIVNKRGSIHHVGCDVEICPKCKEQLISCGCNDKIFLE